MGNEEGWGLSPVTLCADRKCHVQVYDSEIGTTADEIRVGLGKPK
jgi:hypothetical protein